MNIFIAGKEINSEFTITGSARDWAVVIESRGGRTRNREYAVGLELILGRLASIGGVLVEAELASKPAMALLASERRLNIELGYPVQLSDVDLRQLRLDLARAQIAIRTTRDRKTGGNGSNRMKMSFVLPSDVARDEDLVALVQGGTNEDDTSAVYDVPSVKSSARRPGQGFMSDPVLKKKVEDHAMEIAKQSYEDDDWIVRDVSASESYDLRVSRGDETRYVEVKGTTGEGAMVLVTRGSVNIALSEGRTDLFVVSRIQVRGDEVLGGDSRKVHGWQPSLESLKPIKYEYWLGEQD